MKLAWLTDIHLNFLDDDARAKFYDSVLASSCDGVIISGDIAEAHSVANILTEMAAQIQKPIYFVLGNHDYYRGRVDSVRDSIIELCKLDEYLFWLPACDPKILEEGVVLVGQDGWADGRYGDYLHSTVRLNDCRYIYELYAAEAESHKALLSKMQELADYDARALKVSLEKALAESELKKIIVVTHVPPFREASTYQGKISNDDFLPYFASKATGDVLLEIAKANAAVEFLVLCGHTHGEATYQALDNLLVRAGAAEYCEPEVQEVIEC